MGTLASGLRPIAEELAGAPRVYVDANLPYGAVVSMRRDLGWDVLFVLEHEDLRRASDVEHYRQSREFGRTLITLDRDFLDDRRFPPDESPGVIVLIAPDEAGLVRLLAHVDTTMLRTPDAGPLPLQGRKLTVVPQVEP